MERRCSQKSRKSLRIYCKKKNCTIKNTIRSALRREYEGNTVTYYDYVVHLNNHFTTREQLFRMTSMVELSQDDASLGNLICVGHV